MPQSKTRLRSRSKARSSSSRTRSKTRSSHHRSSAAAVPKQPLEDQLMTGLLRSGVPKENATIIASLILSVVGTYDDNPKVAEKAQEAAEEVVDSIEAADAKKVRAALTKAGAAAAAALAEQRGGSSLRGGVRWDRPLPAGYTTATAGLAALAFGTVQLIKHILQKNNCDSRVINVACLMIPCLMHALPELLAPGAVPGLAYVPVEAQAPHED